MIQAFNFLTEVHKKDVQIVNDQNVFEFEFRNLGDVPVWINNNIFLPGITVSEAMSIYKESIDQSEKTKAQYFVRFETDTDFEERNLIIIKKIPSK